MTGFWEYRHEQEQLGQANGVQPFATKAYYAGVSTGVENHILPFSSRCVKGSYVLTSLNFGYELISKSYKV